MDILYLLLPMSVLLALGVLALFGWALHGGQFEDLEREGLRVLDEPVPTVPVPESPSRPQLP